MYFQLNPTYFISVDKNQLPWNVYLRRAKVFQDNPDIHSNNVASTAPRLEYPLSRVVDSYNLLLAFYIFSVFLTPLWVVGDTVISFFISSNFELKN